MIGQLPITIIDISDLARPQVVVLSLLWIGAASTRYSQVKIVHLSCLNSQIFPA